MSVDSSVDSCVAFFDLLSGSPDLGAELKAISDPREIVALGHRCGFAFDERAFIAALPTVAGKVGELLMGPAPVSAAARVSAWHHYEFDMDDIPALSPVVETLDALKIMPATVDLDAFAGSFRAEDLAWTDMSPAAAAFRSRYQDIMTTPRDKSRPEYLRRDFHLVNLDRNIDHPLYNAYFQAKVRMIAALEQFFGTGVRFSGSLWYPPSSYRLWHTNETQPGWRMYLIDFDSSYDISSGGSFFRYMNPESREMVTLDERPRMMRFFKIEQDPTKLFWHCIVNRTLTHRWSFGFEISEGALDRLGV